MTEQTDDFENEGLSREADASAQAESVTASPPRIKGRSFDTFYLFCVAMLGLAIVTQVVAIATYR